MSLIVFIRETPLFDYYGQSARLTSVQDIAATAGDIIKQFSSHILPPGEI
jgi:hypothetical protein